MRTFTLACLSLSLFACDFRGVHPDPNHPEDPYASEEPIELTEAELRCLDAAPGLELIDGPLQVELGRQGGSHISVQFTVTGVELDAHKATIEIYEGADLLASTAVSVWYRDAEACRVTVPVVLANDGLYWDVIDAPEPARELSVVVRLAGVATPAPGRWTRPLEALDSYE